jgi:hypothetical protein
MVMANPQRTERGPKSDARNPAKLDKQAEESRRDKQAEESRRDQAKTETEERPYLDTEGGE